MKNLKFKEVPGRTDCVLAIDTTRIAQKTTHPTVESGDFSAVRHEVL
jgi:hypothetical protein